MQAVHLVDFLAESIRQGAGKRNRSSDQKNSDPARAHFSQDPFHLSLQSDGDVLDFQILFDSPAASLSAEAVFLHTAEGSLGCLRHPVIDADDSILQPFGNADGVGEIPGVEISGQSEWSIVSEGQSSSPYQKHGWQQGPTVPSVPPARAPSIQQNRRFINNQSLVPKDKVCGRRSDTRAP